MANYQLLKADIDKKVYQNGEQEITGANLNSVLNAMVTTLGAEYQFAGVATKDTNPEVSDAKVFYIANGKGTYTNFGRIEVTEDEVVVLYYDTEWHKVSTGIASQAKLSELIDNYKIGISIIPAPNINTVSGTLEFDQDSILYIGGKSYELPNSISLDGVNSSWGLLFFDLYNQQFIYGAYSDFPYMMREDNIILVGSIIKGFDSGGRFKNFEYASFPFSFTVDGKFEYKRIEEDLVSKIEAEIGKVRANEEEIKNFIGFNPYNFNFAVSGEAPTINAELINFNCEQGKTYVLYHKTTGTQWTHYVYLQNVWSQSQTDRLQTIEFLGSEDYTTTEFTCNVEGGTKYILATAYSNGNGGQVDFFIVEKDSIIGKVEELRTSGVDLSKIEAEIDDVRKGLYGSNIFDVNKKQYFKNLFIQANWASRNGGNTPHISPLVMLWFSDIHGSQYNYNRLIEFKNYFNEYIQASICTGDIVNDHYGDDFSYFTANDIMLVIGNHDVQDGTTGEHTHTGLEAYNTYFKDKISNWGVIQPENAATEGLCYYYKDFTDRGIRLIVLDKMAWNSAQNTWLQGVLTDAKNNNLAVICANHYPASIVKDTKCSFCSLYTDELGGMPTDLINSVESFINNGGEFICHLSGHTHADYYGIISGTTQISITIDCAYSAYDAWNDSDRVSGEKSADCFNILSIDTYDKTIKMFRVGVDRDRWLRHKGTMCVKYDTRELLWND